MNAVTPTAQVTERKAKTDARHEQLLIFARGYFAKHGYEESSLRDIAAAFGKSAGMITARYPTKDAFFAAVLDADCKEYLEEMSIAAKAEGEVLEVLTNFVAADYRHQAMQLQLVRDKLALWWRKEEHTTRHMLDFLNATRFLLAEILRKAVSRGELDFLTPNVVLSKMLWDIYIAGYQGAALRDPDVDAKDRCTSFKIQAKIMLAGYLIVRATS